jgi:hypothetical protein
MKKKATKKTKSKPYHVVYYVEDATPAMRKFYSLEDMETFFREFNAQYDKEGRYTGTYLDFCITNISGEIKFL